jgi:hypothetical protein
MDQRGIEIVDAISQSQQFRVGHGGSSLSRKTSYGKATGPPRRPVFLRAS